MIPFLQQRRAAPVLGLGFDSDHLQAVVARRTNGSVDLRAIPPTPVSLDPLTNEPALVGREWRKILDEAAIRDRRCAVCLPVHWTLSVLVELPDLPEVEIADLLQLEAERGFPYPPDSLIIASSRFQVPSGQRYALLVAVLRDHVARLEAALLAAQLRPETFALGIASLVPPGLPDSEGVLSLLPSPHGITLQITSGGGLALLRRIEGTYEIAAGTSELQTDLLFRELRITLAQLPPGLRESLRCLRICGDSELATELYEALHPLAPRWNLEIERSRHYLPGAFPVKLPSATPLAPATSLAVRTAATLPNPLEFLPPKITAWQRLVEHFSSGKLLWSSAAAGTAAALVAFAFLIQQFRIWHWESRWNAIAKPATELEALQKNIRQYRPWFDDSFRSLAILRRLTEAFPAEGTVSAKSVELRGPSTVICSGTARNERALLDVLDHLRASKDIAKVNLEQARGTPVEFTFNFQWSDRSSP